jgi:hypothetical protein
MKSVPTEEMMSAPMELRRVAGNAKVQYVASGIIMANRRQATVVATVPIPSIQTRAIRGIMNTTKILQTIPEKNMGKRTMAVCKGLNMLVVLEVKLDPKYPCEEGTPIEEGDEHHRRQSAVRTRPDGKFKKWWRYENGTIRTSVGLDHF